MDDNKNRWNFMSFIYLIKDIDQIVNFFDYYWTGLKKTVYLFLFYIILNAVVVAVGLPYFNNFIYTNVQRSTINHLQPAELISLSNNHQNNSLKIDSNISKSDNILSYINRREELILYLDKISIFINLYKLLLSFLLLAFSVLLFYIFGFLPGKKDYEHLINTELSWWNPLSIWYGFMIRMSYSSIWSRALWLLTYCLLIYKCVFIVKDAVKMIMILKFSFYILLHVFNLFFYYLTFPRWYSSNTNYSNGSDSSDNSSLIDE